MRITRTIAIRTAAAVATIGILAAGSGMAIAATNGGTNRTTPWGGMLGGAWGGATADASGRGFGPGMMGGGFGPGMMGGGFGPGMMGGGWGTSTTTSSPMLTAAASYLGLSTDTLIAKLQSGTTLADLATQSGRTTAGLADAMLAAMRTALDASPLSAAQQAAMLDRMRDHIDDMLTLSHTQTGTGFRGMMGGSWGASS